MDSVISMGCCPASSICPVYFSGNKIDWNIPDPYGGDIVEYERVADIIQKKIEEFIQDNFK